MADTVQDNRYARAPHLWALGVGAVISGDFFGWQTALSAGFLGLVVNLVLASVLYILLSFSIAELSTSVPCGGGPYAFAHRALGSTSAYFAGLAEVLKVVVTVAVIAVGIGAYMNQLLKLEEGHGPIWWVVFYVLFTVLNLIGVALSFRVQVAATVLSVVILIVFYIGAISYVDYGLWVRDQDWEWKDGASGLVNGFSFSMWFFLGIEELPLAVEDTIDPQVNMPRGLISSIVTLFVLAFSTAFFNTTISPGASAIFESASPLLDGYKTVFGDNSVTSGFSWLLIVGLLASFHSFIYCMGRLVMAMARDGFLPAILANVHPIRQTPTAGILAGTSIGLVTVIVMYYSIGFIRLGAVLINLALLGALISYAFQLVSFLALRVREPDLARPYRSPFGMPGALLCLGLVAYALFTIVYQGAGSSDFLVSIVIAILYFVLGAAWFAGVARHHIKPLSVIHQGERQGYVGADSPHAASLTKESTALA
ncbi:hypothetical protein H257_09253 [Aphanomyces astaci]|uniref:Amino acid permease/ SLC12A domain-containing protein n=1 Tax=Aphanomyces astaci TaxID=112090 RepID=W4GCK7_APHAT|nr:hypothetical protein H257_09253 [Aphanomyces astaci]ETV76804.1 hypothetical protein H257_09253 [Aphanomyces astaci]RQM23691.1 hypothetical protein B5M09_003088 [Aphanomyces astaci]|eukprot:XP_009833716.1 hypothetical protein H257_09253 [Aphanomyces astaci]